MQKTCRNCNQAFEITESDLAFYEKVSPEFGPGSESGAGSKKYLIPPPTLCPDCRFQNRLAYRAASALYNARCSLSDQEIISVYSPDKHLKVYEQKEWWSDKWNGLDYGRDFDFSRPFFDQFFELVRETPHVSMINVNCENSYYTNHQLNSKNCYLLFGGTENENALYGYFVNSSSNVVDTVSVFGCEWCYESTGSVSCNMCAFTYDSRNCHDCLFIQDCANCHDCIGCFGLRNKEYHIFNEYVGKERFLEMKKSLYPLTPNKIDLLRKKFDAMKAQLPHLGSHIYNCENSTGDMLSNSQNTFDAFDSRDCRDSRYLSFSPKAIDSQDATFNAPHGVEMSYNVVSTVGGQNMMCTHLAWFNDHLLYSMECYNSSYLFGCSSLKRNQYCILNKQYTKEEYEVLVPRIIQHMQKTGEWGEFFPMQNALLCYNESIANQHFPLSKEAILSQGLQWKEDDMTNKYEGPKVLVRETIDSVTDDIVKQILTCDQCGKNYKIIPQELRFYRTMKLPLPLKCFNCRHMNRMKLRNPRKLFSRSCDNCKKDMQTTYSPDRPEKVFCEECYLGEVY